MGIFSDTLKFILLFIFFCTDILALPSNPVASKKEATIHLLDIHQSHRITFFCEQPFSITGEIKIPHCKNCPQTSNAIQWIPIVSHQQLAKHLLCFNEKICVNKNGTRFKGIRCCKELDKNYSLATWDLHNFVPEQKELKQQRRQYRFGQIENFKPVNNECHFYVDKKNKMIEPAPSTRGLIARTFLYMRDTYHLPLSQEELIQYQNWHQEYPVSEWERVRNEKIKAIQGNGNPYIN